MAKKPAAKKKKPAKLEGSRTLLVDQGGNKKFKITIPADWKVTFGPWSPPQRNSRSYGSNYEPTGTLRIYEAENKQRACFAPVLSFYDVDLEISHLVTIQQGDKKWTEDSKGNYESNKKLLVESTWEDDDDM